ncbi:MAG: hypothetical protein JWR84_3782 [Caulobacter sp.]|nr:hypothetical protein [Caulobacter sp.]
MKRLAGLGLAAALLASSAGAQPSGVNASVPLSMDETWLEVVKFAGQRGLTTETADRANGRFVATGSKVWAAYIRCPRRLKDVGYDLDVTLAPDGAGRTAVIVAVHGSADQVRRRHFLVFKGRQVRREFDCPSTGALEEELFAALKGGKR